MTAAIPSAETLILLRVRIGLASDDSSQDDEITLVYGMAVSMLESYLDRILYFSGPVQETFTHSDRCVLSLKGYPVVSVSVMTATEGESLPSYHVEKLNGLIHFDGRIHAHELVVDYVMEDPLVGVLMLATTLLFDQLWVMYNSTVDNAANGTVKAITSDGARVEFDVSSGSSAGIDVETGLPAATIGLLSTYRRQKC